jgi:thymidylate kinase
MAYPGRLIVFEGPDGVGKTTLAGGLRSYLENHGVRCELFSFPGKETGTLGGLVYNLHHADPRAAAPTPDATALQVAHVAAHIDKIERQILPALREGACVVLDRYWWSTWVCGTVAGANPRSLDAMLRLERHHWRGVAAPFVILLRRERRSGPQVPGVVRMRAEYQRLFAEQSKRRRSNCAIVENNGAVGDGVATVGHLTERLWQPLTRRQRNVRESRTGQLRLLFDVPSPSGAPARRSESVSTMVIAARLAPAKPTEVYDTYWRFAAERQAIFFRRLEHRPPPWTHDPVLQAHRFTNAYRASDRVSQYLIRHVIHADSQTPDDLLFRILLFKVFNKIDTWRLLEAECGEIRWSEFSLDRYASVFDRAFARGTRIYSAAYIMPSGGRGNDTGRKHSMHLRLIERMIRDNLAARLTEAKSMEAAFQTLRGYPTIGDFLAYQFITDVNYSDLTQFNESDFVMPGPGARDGIRKCFSDLGGLSEQEIIKLMVDRQEREFERLGLTFRSLWGRQLHLIDCQNIFCEVDKYARAKHPLVAGVSGRTRIKRRYSIDPEPLELLYPRKYNLDEAIARWRTHVSAV